MSALDGNKQNYDKQLYSDWITKVYDRCRVNCIINPFMYNSSAMETIQELDANMQEIVQPNERECGKNCLRKYDKIYKLYTNME